MIKEVSVRGWQYSNCPIEFISAIFNVMLDYRVCHEDYRYDDPSDSELKRLVLDALAHADIVVDKLTDIHYGNDPEDILAVAINATCIYHASGIMCSDYGPRMTGEFLDKLRNEGPSVAWGEEAVEAWYNVTPLEVEKFKAEMLDRIGENPYDDSIEYQLQIL